jgi:hypothetical protein
VVAPLAVPDRERRSIAAAVTGEQVADYVHDRGTRSGAIRLRRSTARDG